MKNHSSYHQYKYTLYLLFNYLIISSSLAQNITISENKAGLRATFTVSIFEFFAARNNAILKIELPDDCDSRFSGNIVANGFGGEIDPIDRANSVAQNNTLFVVIKTNLIGDYLRVSSITCDIVLGSRIGFFYLSTYDIYNRDGSTISLGLTNNYGFRVYPETVATPFLKPAHFITNISFASSFDDVYYADTYVDIATSPTFSYESLICENCGSLNDTIIINFLQPGKTYYYRMRSYYCGMFSSYSNVQSVTLLKNEQSINWNQDLSQYSIQYGDSSVQYGLQISSSSGLPIEFMISNPAIVSIKDDKLYFINVGMVTITAKQSGDETFYAAKDSSQTITILPRATYVSGAEAENKVYDGTTHAKVNGATLYNIIENDNVHLSNSTEGKFVSCNVGYQIEVNTNMILIGSDANKYTLNQPWLQANILQPTTEIIVSPKICELLQGTNLASCFLNGGQANVDGVFSLCNPEYIPMYEGELVSYLFTPFDSNYPIQYGLTSVRFNTTTDITTSQECFKIWINNVNNLIYYSGEKEGAYYKIINTSGQIVKNGTLNGIPISMDNLPKGSYVLNVENMMMKFISH